MACYACGYPIRFNVEQNIANRLCLFCRRHTCLICGDRSHFPSRCHEAEYLELIAVPPVEDEYLLYLDLMDRLYQLQQRANAMDEALDSFILGPIGVALEFVSHPVLYRTFAEVHRIVNILRFLCLSYRNDWGLEGAMLTIHNACIQAVDALIESYPVGTTPLDEWLNFFVPRNQASAVTINLLMHLLRSLDLLGRYTLRDCLPELPEFAFPAPQVGDPMTFDNIFNRVIFQMLHALPIEGNVEEIAFVEDFGFDFGFEMDPYEVGNLDAAFCYAVYAECFLWRFRQIPRS